MKTTDKPCPLLAHHRAHLLQRRPQVMFVQSFQDLIQLQKGLLEIQVHVQSRFLWENMILPLEDNVSKILCCNKTSSAKDRLERTKVYMRSCGLLPATCPSYSHFSCGGLSATHWPPMGHNTTSHRVLETVPYPIPVLNSMVRKYSFSILLITLRERILYCQCALTPNSATRSFY